MDRRRMSENHDYALPQHVKRRKLGQDHEDEPLDRRYTVAWICALHIEMAAARAMLDQEYVDRPQQAYDTNSYVLGAIQNHNIVIACLPASQYGTNNAATVLSNVKRTFPDIQIGLMVGIGGGVPTKADIRLGDIVVGVRVMQYDLGKTLSDSFQRTSVPRIPDSSIRTVISNLRSRHELSGSRVPSILSNKMGDYPPYCLPTEPDRLFLSSYNHDSSLSSCEKCDQSKLVTRKLRSSTGPVIHYGGIASANTVMKNSTTRDEIARDLDVICFEMEAAGLMDIMPCLPIRGICDYSDSHKTKEYQRYAAATAAAYAYEFLQIWGGGAPTIKAEYGKLPNEGFLSSAREDEILESLDFDGIDARKTTIKAAHSKTCRWILKHPDYLSWVNPEHLSEHNGFLWIRGKPGAGKSTLMKFIYLKAKRQEQAPQSLTASFFFNARGDILEKTVSGMYRSLLLQLFEGFPDLKCVLADPEILPRRQTGCPSLNVLKDLLRSAVFKLGQRSFTCFIDALDECDEQQVMDLVEYFEDLAEQCTEDGVRLSICFSSRHYPYIDVRLGIRLILEDQVGHANDLESYIKANLRIKDPSLLMELQEKMLEKAAGVFLWVVLVTDILKRENCRGRLSLKMRLEQVPNGLSELFKDLLRRDTTNMEELKLSVLWILLSKRPLKPEEYYHAIWSGLSLQGLADPTPPEVDTADSKECFIRCAISSSKGLAEVTKSKPTVQFIHESVRDFLVKDEGLFDLWPDLKPDWESVGHEKLKLCCYSYLQIFEHDGNSPFYQNHLNRQEWFGNYPLFEYASQSVLHHGNSAGDTVCQRLFLEQFQSFCCIWIVVINHFEKFNIRKYTPGAGLLYILADRGHSSLLRTRLLDDQEINVSSEGDRYEYPLIAAMAKGYKNSVVALLRLSSGVHDVARITDSLISNANADGRNHSPLSWACKHGHLGVVEFLISRGIQDSEIERRRSTLLMLASKNGHAEIAALLIDHGGDVHAYVRGETAISLASANGHTRTVEVLLEKGADPNPLRSQGRSALFLAVSNGHDATVELLLKSGKIAKWENSLGQPALHLTTQKATVEVLIRHGADIHARDVDGLTCLMHAVRNWARIGTIEYLVNNGADVKTQDGKGNTCLHYAFHRGSGHYDTVKILLMNGARVNTRNGLGRTCLHEMQYLTCSLPEVKRLFQLLFSYETDGNIRDDYGNIPLHLMHENTDWRIFVPLINQPGLDLNACNKWGKTPLHVALEKMQVDIAALLVSGGADVNITDAEGRTPLDAAIQANDYRLVPLLIGNGAKKGITH
ncbi:Ff.00g108180.m01.CDS01 [Fusarium sp. VM40]|nr:Ff.00g108180.m01.CDS01 [Fusarium sp. VM40]